MPRGDKSGPEGRGAMTGRALGYCAGHSKPGFAAETTAQRTGRNFRNGTGRGMRFGRRQRSGLGCGRGYFQNRSSVSRDDFENENLESKEFKEREITRLENLANTLSNELAIVKDQLEKLQTNN